MRSIFAEISNNEVVNVSKCNQMLSKNMNCETFLYFLILQIWRSPVKSRNLFCSAVIQMMETNLEEPISPAILAKDVGMSTRQLERLFRRYLNRSPKRYYMELRLQKARNLLMQTNMSVINVALACGFASPSHFSKCYRAHYDTTPYRERGSYSIKI